MARARMHDHADGFVHHEHGVVLEDDRERDRLGDERLRRGRGDLDVHGLAAADAVRRLARAAIDAHMAVVDERLHAGARELRHALGEPAVQARAGRRRIDREALEVHAG